MSSDELRRSGGSKEIKSFRTGNLMDNRYLPLGLRNINTNIKPTKQQTDDSGESDKMECEPTNVVYISPARKSLAPSVKEHKLFNPEPEKTQSIGGYLPQRALPHHSYEKPGNSAMSTAGKEKGVFLLPVTDTKKKTFEDPRIAASLRSRDFAQTTFELPLTRRKVAQSLSLEEACVVLPLLMKNKRGDLKLKESQLDQVSVDLQKALLDAKNICVKMGNYLPDTDPEDITALVVHAEKLMYLLSSSFRIFEKLDHWGSVLQEGLQVYSKDAEEFHVSVDVLLDYIMESILKKCKRTDMTLV